jgi:hypothetical protein
VKHRVTVELDDFGYEALVDEARRQDVPIEELLAHAAMYYLADLDSGRIAARVLRAPGEKGEPRSGRRFRPGPEKPGEPGDAA